MQLIGVAHAVLAVDLPISQHQREGIPSSDVLTDSDDMQTDVHAWRGDIGLFERKAG